MSYVRICCGGQDLRDATAGVVEHEVEVLVEGGVLGVALPRAHCSGVQGVELT